MGDELRLLVCVFVCRSLCVCVCVSVYVSVGLVWACPWEIIAQHGLPLSDVGGPK